MSLQNHIYLIVNHVRKSDDDSKMNIKRLIAVCTRQSIEKVPFKHFFSYVFVNANVFPQMFKKQQLFKTWCYDYFEDRYE